MRHLIASSSSLLSGAFLLVLASGLVSTLLGVRLVQEGYPAYVPGIVGAAYFVGIVTGSLTIHRALAGVGHIRIFAACASVCSAAMLAHGFALDPYFWSGLRLLEGFCIAGLYICIESWLHDRASNETRGQLLSVYMTVVYFGLGASQLLLNLWEPSSFALFGVCSLLMSISLVPVALTRTPAPPLPSPQFFGIRRLYAISPLGITGSVASGVVLGAFYGLGPVFAAGAGLDVAGTARFMTATILGGLVLQWPLGWLSDRFDRRTVISSVCAAIALFGAAMFFGKALSEPVLLAGAVVYGGAIFSLSPLCIAHANDYITSDDRVGASGGLMLAYGVGAVVGPLLASAAIMGLGTGGLFALGAAVGLATLLFAFWRMAQRTALPLDQQGEFQPLPRTSPYAAELGEDPDTPTAPAAEILPRDYEDDDIF